MVPDFQAEYLSERILHSKLIVVPGGSHNFHLNPRMSADVNTLILNFLVEADDSATHSREFAAMPPKDRKDPSIVHHSPRC